MKFPTHAGRQAEMPTRPAAATTVDQRRAGRQAEMPTRPAAAAADQCRRGLRPFPRVSDPITCQRPDAAAFGPAHAPSNTQKKKKTK